MKTVLGTFSLTCGLCILCYIIFYMDLIFHQERHEPPRSITYNWFQKSEEKSDKIQEERLFRLGEVCKNQSGHQVSPTGYFYSNTANMAICHVAKAGSSFCGQFIVALDEKQNEDGVQNAFKMDRSQVHFRKRISEKELLDKNSTFYSAKRVIVGRNPFSRLYSGYIDKFFLLHAIGQYVMKELHSPFFYINGNKCGYNITFSDFLRNVVSNIKKGKTVNEHMRPVSVSCSLCVIKYDFVVLKETLSRDLSDIVKELLPQNRSAFVSQYLQKDWNTVTLESLVKDQFKNYFLYTKDCPNIIDYLEKLWLSLQIQAYIHKSISFPRETFTSQNISQELLVQVVMAAKNSIPMSNLEIEQQRQGFLEDAYSCVSSEIKEDVILSFKDDFEAFGYNKTPPS